MEPQPAQAQQDANHLQLLSTFHYVVAGVSALCWGTFPLIHLVLGLTMMFNPAALGDVGSGGPPPMFGAFFALIGGALAAAGWGMGIALFIAARYLQRRTHYRYCFVVAAISCALMPFGTVLGVFTLIVLSRPSVKALFGVPA